MYTCLSSRRQKITIKDYLQQLTQNSWPILFLVFFNDRTQKRTISANEFRGEMILIFGLYLCCNPKWVSRIGTLLEVDTVLSKNHFGFRCPWASNRGCTGIYVYSRKEHALCVHPMVMQMRACLLRDNSRYAYGCCGRTEFRLESNLKSEKGKVLRGVNIVGNLKPEIIFSLIITLPKLSGFGLGLVWGGMKDQFPSKAMNLWWELASVLLKIALFSLFWPVWFEVYGRPEMIVSSTIY